nr:MAG TPA: hypothetical protein [Caudoviricetes sp.]
MTLYPQIMFIIVCLFTSPNSKNVSPFVISNLAK